MENTQIDETQTPMEEPQPFQARRPLPSGGWVDLRDPMQLRKKDKDGALSGINARNLGGAGVDLTNNIILTVVADWSVPYLPGAVAPFRNPGLLGELTLADGNALESMANEYKPILFPELPSVDQAGIPGSPTPPASA